MDKKFIIGIVSGLVLIGLIVFLVVIFRKKNTNTNSCSSCCPQPSSCSKTYTNSEVFQIVSPTGPSTIEYEDIQNFITQYNTDTSSTVRLATTDDLTNAQKIGAQWCVPGWIENNTSGTGCLVAYPMQNYTGSVKKYPDTCGGGTGGVLWPEGTGPVTTGAYNVNVFGIKPDVSFINDKKNRNKAQYGMIPFYMNAWGPELPFKWSQYD